MADSELLVSPSDTSDAISLSQSASEKLFRKRILPKASINYRGRKISFDEQYLTDLAQSFNSGAYDQVPFMLADTANSHTMDVERMRGEVTGVDVADDGLYATVRVTGTAVKLLELHPKIGVSARILENYERSDGRKFPRALQHVLATTDPVITGLGAWEEVNLSNAVPGVTTLDLSAASYEELGADSTDSTDTKEEPVASREDYLRQVAEATDMTVEDLEALGMTDEELEIFASAFATSEDTVTAEVDDELIEEPGEDSLLNEVSEDESAELPSEAEIEAAVEALSDEELAELAAELGIEEETEVDAEAETEADAEAEADADTEEVEAVTEEVAEPTDADLAERLGTGEFGSGIDEPVQDDPNLGDLSDEALAEMSELWTAAKEKDDAAHLARTEEEAAIAAEAEEAAGADEVVPESAPVLAGAGAVTLSNEAAPEVVSLSNQVNALQQQLAVQQFDALKTEYVRKGVPAALVDLARPVLLAGTAATLEFSNAVGSTETVDAAAIVKQLLDSATGYIDLARERGHSYTPEGDDKAAMEAAEDKRLASLWGEQFGI